MEKRTLGKTGMVVTTLGFGGAEIGFENAAYETVERLLHSALDAGLNLIDTAECYKESEEMIGRAVSGQRDDYLLFTKTGHSDDNDHWNPKKMTEGIDRSLQRLRTDRVDLIQLHSCSEELLRKGEVIQVLERAREAGKTRFIGYSGDSSAARYAVECGAFDTLQTSVSIADQESIALSVPLARERGMGVIAKRPIANAAWKTGAKPASPYHHTYWERLEQLQYDFLKSGAESAIATALRFTLSVPGVDTAIVGTKNPERWKQNATLANQGQLDPTQFQAIRERWLQVAKPDWVGQT
ncbi:MAG: aldo/keto reductase [Acidobacteriota bacterium]|nr:aldo/keto reductase [Acidobacteriota bacterium]